MDSRCLWVRSRPSLVPGLSGNYYREGAQPLSLISTQGPYFPSLEVNHAKRQLQSSSSRPGLRTMRVYAAGRGGQGFSKGSRPKEPLRPKPATLTAVGAPAAEEMKENKGAAAAAAVPCPCGGGENGLEYSDCCKRYHGGVVETDPVFVLRARFSAYVMGKTPYIVRTTHPQHKDLFGVPLSEGQKKLTADCEATCRYVNFKSLHVLGKKHGDNPEEEFVSFRATYTMATDGSRTALKKGGQPMLAGRLGGEEGGEKILEETSRFVKEGGRWLYREMLPLDTFFV
eukprot:TRINITY_DN4293_c0_g1_i3.p1 TRINITY_DN4293_c0_g1~~TRINITY_DN4293_c0_g1_i3.p1  ORF type:complete len:296 (-),score=64.80 TRINITY_DN4293_c0_g1_i3:77-931(-)